MGSVLRLRNIRHRRGGREVLAIDELDLDAGERLAVLGPNGAGKTRGCQTFCVSALGGV